MASGTNLFTIQGALEYDNMPLHMDRLKSLIMHIANSDHVRSLGMTKLYKLIYFIETECARSIGQSISGSEFIKYEHGPVPSRGEKALKQLKKDGFIETKRVSLGNNVSLNKIIALVDTEYGFSNDESLIIEAILKKHGRKSAKILSDLSHEEPAWKNAAMKDTLDETLMLYGAYEDPVGL